MNFFSIHKKTLPSLAVASLLALGIQPVSASSAFSTDSTVTLTFNSITSSSGSTSGLSISGLFEIGDPLTAPGFGKSFTGDGQASYTYTGASLPSTLGAGDSFTQYFNAQGSAGNGTINSYYQSYGSFDFTNNSISDIYTVNFSLDYSLDAVATGSTAGSQASIDYSDDWGSIFGSDQAIANNSHTTASNTTPLTFNMVLNPGNSNSFYADIALTGSAASTSPVPLPATLWLFLSAVIGLRGYKSRAIQTHS
ncbi:MAG: hypothetical protein QM500_01070 [Methylococcales bacterium]